MKFELGLANNASEEFDNLLFLVRNRPGPTTMSWYFHLTSN